MEDMSEYRTRPKKPNRFRWIKTKKGMIWIIGLCLVLITTFIMLQFYGKLPPSKNVFTQYGPIEYDSTGRSPTIFSHLDIFSDSFDEVNFDSLFAPATIEEKRDTLSTEPMAIDSSQLRVDETLNPGDTNATAKVAQGAYLQLQQLLEASDKARTIKDEVTGQNVFNELMISSPQHEQRLKELFAAETSSYASVLKIITLVGQQIILDEDDQFPRSILDVLAESQNIASIYILDRKCRTVYVDKSKTKPISFADLNIACPSNQEIELLELHAKRFIVLPIYFTYGRIGAAVVVMKK